MLVGMGGGQHTALSRLALEAAWLHVYIPHNEALSRKLQIHISLFPDAGTEDSPYHQSLTVILTPLTWHMSFIAYQLSG